MKEAQIFENWINNLSEGTWALPETPEQMEKLNQLMSAELIVGPDATNATEQLYDIVGDDELFDILNDLADKSEGRANCWDDSDVQRRLAELGIQTPESTRAEPADVAQDTAPAVKEDQLDEIGDTPAGKDALRAVQNRAYDTMDAWSKNSASGFSATPKQVKKATGAATAAGNRLHGFGPDRMKQDTVMARDALRKQLSVAEGGEKDRQWSNKDMERLRVATRDFDDILSADGPEAIKQNLIKKRIQTKPMAGPKGVLPEQGMAEGDNRATFVEDRELAEMLKYAGVPIREGVLTDSTGSTLEHIKDTFQRDVKDFTQSGEMSDALYDVLYDYYFDDMPYGTKKAKDGDPHEWVSNRFAQDIGLDEGVLGTIGGAALGSMLGGPIGAAAGAVGGQEMTKGGSSVIEGSCNMTMEGEYCPEHGLMECGSMEEDGGAVGMPYSMGEAQAPQDPINSNSAMTGSYYEGKETDVQAGDALLARIKSLALLR